MDETFEQYVRARGDALRRFGYVVCGNRHLAEDLVQEVLARVYRKWSRLAHIEQPDAYFRTAVVRQYLSWRRRPARREVPLASAHEPAGADPATGHAVRDEVWRLLATLPRRQRAVLVLRYYEDLTDDQIAEVIGCRPATVRSHVHRALGRLREQLRPAPDMLTWRE